MEKKYHILLADDHTLFREGIKLALSSHPEFEVVAEASNGFEAIDLARKFLPDIILMDIAMPKCNGIKATAVIKQEIPKIKIAMLTVSNEGEDLYEALCVGASGYLLKDLQPKDLYNAVKIIGSGEVLLAGSVADKILADFKPRTTQVPIDLKNKDHLTEREYEILGLVSEGLSNAEIANRLTISSNTVKNHLSNILSKLQLRNRNQLTAYAIRKGFDKDLE